MTNLEKNLGKKGKSDKEPDYIRPIFDPDSVEPNYSYTDTLKNFLLHKPVTNIALEGDFATGKSSVLYALLKDGCIKKKKPKLISSLALDYGNQQNENEGKKTREDVSNTPTSISANNSSIVITGTKPEDNKDFVVTLQSEIVRQLFYGEKANKIKNSPYGRMGRSYFAIPLAITVIVCLGWIVSILKLAKDDNLIKYYFWNYCWLWVLLIPIFVTCVFVTVRKIITLISKSGIKHISLKDINFDLNDDKPDFKQLIDFIIEYFRITKRKIIIFEDLDRYDNPKIFEELNNLNQAINHSEYFKKDKNKVKFLYLTSGKIFNSASNKNKVFDAIIPMIPFMSASNAEYLFEQELKSRGIECAAAVEVIGAISNLVTDMRVLKSIANRFALYWKVFELSNADDEDCKDCASLSVIAELCPEEFDKLTRNDSVLDSIRIAGEMQRNEDILSIESDLLPRNIVANNIDQIRKKIMALTNETESRILRVMVGDNRDDIISTDLILRLLMNANLDMILVFRGAYGGEQQKPIKNADIRQIIKEVAPLAVDRERAENEIREEISRKVEESILRLGLNRKKNEEIVAPESVERLIEGGLVSEAYVDYVAKSESIPKRDFVIDFLTNAIRRRDKKYGYSYPISYYSEDVISKMRDSDYLSVGILNFDLFDSLYRSPKTDLRTKRIMKIANIHEREFIDFCVAYLEHCAQLMPMSSEKNYSLQMFEELLNNNFRVSIKIIEATYSKDSGLASSLMGVALASKVFSEENVKVCSAIPNFANYIETSMGEIATDNAIRCHLSNGARIEKLVYYNQESKWLKDNLDKITIFMNNKNIHEMRTDILNDYLLTHAISHREVDDVLKNGLIDARTVEIVLDRLNELNGDKYDDVLKNIYAKAIQFDIKLLPAKACLLINALDKEEIEKYIVENCKEKQEVVNVLKASQKIEFAKIDASQKQIKIKNNRIGVEFALKLEELGLVQIIKKKNDEYLKNEIIKLRVL